MWLLYVSGSARGLSVAQAYGTKFYAISYHYHENTDSPSVKTKFQISSNQQQKKRVQMIGY